MIKVPSLEIIQNRLLLIFPESIDNYNYLTREICVKTVFVMFYLDAIEGKNNWIRPNQVTRMTDQQASYIDEQNRKEWGKASLKGVKEPIRGRWYADNTREPIRDESIRYGLIAVGAVIERQGLAKTASTPRYALTKDFASLFNEELKKDTLNQMISDWQKKYLSKDAISRITISRTRLSHDKGNILVQLPNGESRLMSPGKSSILSKEVIEVFTSKFLINPELIFLSESGTKVLVSDDILAQKIGININAQENLPDIIMADLGPEHIPAQSNHPFRFIVPTLSGLNYPPVPV